MLSVLGVYAEQYPCPDWYAIGAAAKYWNVDPQRMLEMSIYWADKAFIAMNAESSARKQLRAHGM